MKKALKVFLIIIGVLAVLMGAGIVALLLHGPSQPIILTEEEEQAQQQEQTAIYASTNLDGFSTKTITGEEVTSDIFKDYDITMVNIWYTGCVPCIEEMPEIADLYDNLPSNYNVITICTDTIKDNGKDDKEAIKFSKEVMEKSKAKFMTLVPDDIIDKQISEVTTIFPTTIFVDSSGKAVGDPHFGGRSAEEYLKSINERASLLNQEASN